MNAILYHFPYKYLDASREIRARDAKNEEYALIRASASAPVSGSYIRRGLHVSRAALREALDREDAGQFSSIWFNRAYVKRNLIPHTEYLFFGRAERLKNGGMRLINPLFERTDDLKRLGKILPLYRKFDTGERIIKAANVPSIIQKAIIKNAFDNSIPSDILKRYGLQEIHEALNEIHRPQTMESAQSAVRSLQTAELSLKLAVYMILRERESGLKRNVIYNVSDADISEFIKNFPFTLTDDQFTSINEIAADLRGGNIMNRLLEGDVGSGKTAVAACALFMAAASGHQSVFMAPTEVLARQHYRNLSKVFLKTPFRIILLTGSLTKDERDTAYFNILHGEYKIIIGTHAVFSEGLQFADLALIVTDEQHRFGVAQRGALEKKGLSPDVLALSATPIPRTLSLALYGDLKLSRLHSARVRRDVQTAYVPAEKTRAMFGFTAERLSQNERAYFICPRVEEAEDADGEGGAQCATDVLTDVKTLEKILKASPLAPFGVGVLHGRMKEAEKTKTLEAFAEGNIKALIATTVVEVGIDVPDATVMAIYNADRFGLSQLHQLRGRVGRNGQKAWCFLLSGGNLAETALNRLNVLKSTDDGFKLAEYDYEQRGAGEFLGIRQHGRADFPISADMVRAARDIALELLRDSRTRPALDKAAETADGELGEIVFN